MIFPRSTLFVLARIHCDGWGLKTIDLFQLHRPDLSRPTPRKWLARSRICARSGKVRHFGVSNFRPSQVTTLQVFCPMPLLVSQVGNVALENWMRLPMERKLDQCLIERLTPLRRGARSQRTCFG